MPLALALAFSALLHATTLAMPGWELPGLFEPEIADIEARLTPPGSRPPAPRERPRPRPRRAAAAAEAPPSFVPASDVPAPVAEAAPETVPPPPAEPIAAAAAPPAVEETAPPAPPASPWGNRMRLRYLVRFGEQGFMIGETTQEWQVESGRYRLRSTAEPKGLAALRGKTRSQESEGTIAREGLRPDVFRDRREGRETETVTFDWAENRVTFAAGRGQGELPAGAQDRLSAFYHLAWNLPRQALELPMATASRIERMRFEWIGEETLELPIGAVAALRLRARSGGGETTEVWLAPAHGGLPVMIRHTDRKGDIYDQVADRLETD